MEELSRNCSEKVFSQVMKELLEYHKTKIPSNLNRYIQGYLQPDGDRQKRITRRDLRNGASWNKREIKRAGFYVRHRSPGCSYCIPGIERDKQRRKIKKLTKEFSKKKQFLKIY